MEILMSLVQKISLLIVQQQRKRVEHFLWSQSPKDILYAVPETGEPYILHTAAWDSQVGSVKE